MLLCVDDCLVCRTNTVISPDDGHIVAQNIQRLINILRINIIRINCVPSWLYLQDCWATQYKWNGNIYCSKMLITPRTKNAWSYDPVHLWTHGYSQEECYI